jgi:hypothetical protein
MYSYKPKEMSFMIEQFKKNQFLWVSSDPKVDWKSPSNMWS